MADTEAEAFSNPLAPPSSSFSSDDGKSEHHHSQSSSQPLKNADFRKLMMTPRVTSGGGQLSSVTRQTVESGGQSQRVSQSERGSRPKQVLPQQLSENKKIKKKFHATAKSHEDDTMAELAKRYRDRARERRDGDNPDYHQEESLAQTAAYRAVAPDVKSGMDAAERRKQVIQESKYLGGDMEHTHLVKGLDYALLQKVRAEIEAQDWDEKEAGEFEDEDEGDEKTSGTGKGSSTSNLPDVPDVPMAEDDPFAIRSLYAQSIMRAIKPQWPERNNLFLPGRMAYLFELEEEIAESDIPTTVIRSKAECPHLESMNTLSSNDIVINKLVQILADLRTGVSGKKARKNKEKERLMMMASVKQKSNENSMKTTTSSRVEDSIYGDIGDYVPDLKRRDGREKEVSRGDRDREKDREMSNRKRHRDANEKDHYNRHKDERSMHRDHRDRGERERRETSGNVGQRHNYFDDDLGHSSDHSRQRDGSHDNRESSLGNIIASAIPSTSHGGMTSADNIQTISRHKLAKLEDNQPDSYAECYPGAPENDDAILDSDDEVDYSKMDMGNKKGLIGRWDFDTAEEYGDYMSNKEAMPKAAFQYGVKMADGRKTRRGTGKKDEKAKLDRDYQKISALITRRKAEASESGSGAAVFHTPQIIEYKRHKASH